MVYSNFEILFEAYIEFYHDYKNIHYTILILKLQIIVALRTTELLMSSPVKNPAKSGQLCRMSIRFRFRSSYCNPVPARISFPVAHRPWMHEHYYKRVDTLGLLACGLQAQARKPNLCRGLQSIPWTTSLWLVSHSVCRSNFLKNKYFLGQDRRLQARLLSRSKIWDCKPQAYKRSVSSGL